MTDNLFVGSKTSFCNTPRSWRVRPRFWRVSLASLLWAVVLSLALIMSNDTFRSAQIDFWDPPFSGGPFSVLTLAVLFLFLNPVTDYVSVVETRLILARMSNRGDLASIAILAILDIVLTAAIIAIVMPVPLALLPTLEYSEMLQVLWQAFIMDETDYIIILTPFVYTTFMTSLWTWLYVLSEIAFRLSPYFRNYFPICERPFQSIGLVCSVIVSASAFALSSFWPGP